MDKTSAIVPVYDGLEGLPITVTAMDLKQLALVDEVHEHLRDPECMTITEAIARTGVSRPTFYTALKNPYVQQEKLQEIQVRRDAVHTLLQNYWVHVVKTQVAIASDQQNPREAVQASNFLHRLIQESEEDIESKEEIGGETEATRFLKEFKTRTKGRMRAKRTTTVEEIEVDE